MSKLRFSMTCGAAYDLAVGAAIALALRGLAAVLPIPYPQEPFYARMLGVLLVALGVFYAFAAHDLERNLRIVAGAIVARVVGGLYLVACAASGEIAPFFHVFGGVDLAFGIWHLVLLRSERRTAFLPLLLHGRAVPPDRKDPGR